MGVTSNVHEEGISDRPSRFKSGKRQRSYIQNRQGQKPAHVSQASPEVMKFSTESWMNILDNPQDLQLPKQIIPLRYQILELICARKEEGVIEGVVVKVRDEDGVEKALKAVIFPYKEGKKKQRAVSSFQGEVEFLQAQTDERFVKVDDYFLGQNSAYYVMEYINGVSLDRVINGPFLPSPSESVWIIAELLKGLVSLQSSGYVAHRDVKPSNIILSQEGDVRIIDPVVEPLHYSEGRGIGLCTLQYAPFEFIDKNTVHPSYDVYSLGMLCCSLLGGAFPHEVKHPNDSYINAMKVEKLNITNEKPWGGVPPELQNWVYQYMLTNTVEKRWTPTQALQHFQNLLWSHRDLRVVDFRAQIKNLLGLAPPRGFESRQEERTTASQSREDP